MTQAELDRLAAKALKEIQEGKRKASEPSGPPVPPGPNTLPPQTQHIRPPTEGQTRHLRRRRT